MRPPRAVFAVVAVLTVVVLFVPAGSAAPPPEGICGVCGSAFEAAAADNGVNATVAESTLTIHVTSEGESRWKATVVLNQGAEDAFSEDRTLLEETVVETFRSSRTVVDDPENLSVTLTDRTLTVTFTVQNTTQRYPGGVLLFDAFTQPVPNGDPYLDADTLIVTGPSGTTVTHAPPGGSIQGNQVVWSTESSQQTGTPQFSRGAVIAFAPDDGLLSETATAGAIRMHALGMVGEDLYAYAVVPAGVLAFVAIGLLLGGRRLPSGLSRGRTVTRLLAAGAGLYALVTVFTPVVAGDEVWVALVVAGFWLAFQAFVTAGVAILSERVDVASDRNVTGPAAVAVLAWTLVLLLGVPASAYLVLLCGPVIFYPFGVLAGTGHLLRFGFPVVTALGAVVGALPFVPRAGVVFVTPPMLAVVLTETALLGIPLFALGHRLGRPQPTSATQPKTARSHVGE